VVVRAIGEIGRALNNFWEERERLKIKLQAERDKADETSLSAQLKHVRESLHNLNNQANIANLRHAAEADRLTKHLDIATEELQLARDEIRELREQIGPPLARIVVKQEVQAKKIEANARKIEDVAGKSGLFLTSGLPEPPDDPTDKG
jgi:tRNA nucleotidyltransferase (CCA-adding enzyme)